MFDQFQWAEAVNGRLGLTVAWPSAEASEDMSSLTTATGSGNRKRPHHMIMPSATASGAAVTELAAALGDVVADPAYAASCVEVAEKEQIRLLHGSQAAAEV